MNKSEKSVEELIKYEISLLEKRSGKSWIKADEKEIAIPYTIETLEKLLTTLKWYSHLYTKILDK